MIFKDFIKKYKLKNKATSNLKFYEVLSKMGLEPKVGIYLRGGPFPTDTGVVKLHPSIGIHWVLYIN